MNFVDGVVREARYIFVIIVHELFVTSASNGIWVGSI